MRRADVPPDVLQALNEGRDETVNHAGGRGKSTAAAGLAPSAVGESEATVAAEAGARAAARGPGGRAVTMPPGAAPAIAEGRRGATTRPDAARTIPPAKPWPKTTPPSAPPPPPRPNGLAPLSPTSS